MLNENIIVYFKIKIKCPRNIIKCNKTIKKFTSPVFLEHQIYIYFYKKEYLKSFTNDQVLR